MPLPLLPALAGVAVGVGAAYYWPSHPYAVGGAAAVALVAAPALALPVVLRAALQGAGVGALAAVGASYVGIGDAQAAQPGFVSVRERVMVPATPSDVSFPGGGLEAERRGQVFDDGDPADWIETPRTTSRGRGVNVKVPPPPTPPSSSKRGRSARRTSSTSKSGK